MDDVFCKRVRAAASAGWWTLLIGVAWLSVSWVFWICLLRAQPGWLLQLWGGGDLTWQTVHTLVLEFTAVAKLVLMVWLLGTICLTIWGRKLKRIG